MRRGNINNIHNESKLLHKNINITKESVELENIVNKNEVCEAVENKNNQKGKNKDRWGTSM